MKKKLSVIGVLLSAGLVFCSCGPEIGSKTEKPSESQYIDEKTDSSIFDENSSTETLDTRDYVYKQIDDTLSSDSYKKGSIEQRTDIIDTVLKRLKNDEYISDYYYEMNTDRPVVHYVFSDGIKNTVVLSDIPLNEN